MMAQRGGQSFLGIDAAALRKVVAQVHGPRCAAWLVWNRRASIHRCGAFRVVVPFSARVPKWFRFAIRSLRDHPTWRVKSFTTSEGDCYEVRWRLWVGHVRPMPLADEELN